MLVLVCVLIPFKHHCFLEVERSKSVTVLICCLKTCNEPLAFEGRIFVKLDGIDFLFDNTTTDGFWRSNGFVFESV